MILLLCVSLMNVVSSISGIEQYFLVRYIHQYFKQFLGLVGLEIFGLLLVLM